MTEESMFPELERKPINLRSAVSSPPRDNTAYLNAVRQFREAYHLAESELGSVEISKLEFRKSP